MRKRLHGQAIRGNENTAESPQEEKKLKIYEALSSIASNNSDGDETHSDSSGYESNE
jgi:hypothetical protein